MVVLMLCYFIRIMDPTSSLGRICLGENVYGSSSEKVEGHGDWNAPEYTDTAGSKEKKVTKALSFYKIETDEVSERYIAPCFVNSLEAYDGEINLAFDENLISNEYAVKLCLDYEVKKGNKVVKKELIVALKGELYFVKFIINPKEDDVEPRVIFGRSFMRLVNEIVDFGSGVITVYSEEDPFEDDFEKTEKSMDDWDQLLDFSFDDIPQLDGEELSSFVCKMGKTSRNKKRAMEYLSTWSGFTVLTCKEPITHLDMLSHSMINIISSTHLRHRSINSSNSRMMMSSVEMTQEKKREGHETEMTLSKDSSNSS
ncbi:hypothetical protein Tco_1084823 [Tanacetum coccineum]